MRTVLVLLIAFAALSVSACNTIAGMGQDVSAVGNTVAATAKDAK